MTSNANTASVRRTLASPEFRTAQKPRHAHFIDARGRVDAAAAKQPPSERGAVRDRVRAGPEAQALPELRGFADPLGLLSDQGLGASRVRGQRLAKLERCLGELGDVAVYPALPQKQSVDMDRGRLDRLYETIGDIPIASFTLEDAERAMAALPSDLSSATRRQYAQLISKVLKLAVYPCRLITVSPLPAGSLPKVRPRR